MRVESGRSMKPRLLAGTLLTGLMLLGPLSGEAGATGPGGWGHVGEGGSPGTPSLNGAVYALQAASGSLYVGGNFTDAGGDDAADRIAITNGQGWGNLSPASSEISNGAVNAIAVDPASGYVFAGGTFKDAGGNGNADFLARWDGTEWSSFCNGPGGPPITATVNALQIIGRTLYVAGDFEDGAGIESADRLVACNLDTGAASSTVIDEAHEFSGSIYALTADSDGNLYAGGGFTNFNKDPAADDIAYLDGAGWHAMGSGAGPCGCAVDTFVRSLTAVGTDVYVGTDAKDIAGIPQADNVARWNGSSWSAMGSDTAGSDGWFPTPTTIDGLVGDGSNVYATGSFQNAGGDPTADFIASFDGTAWHPVGSDGAGNGPWSGHGVAVALLGERLFSGGNFTSAGGDSLAHFIAQYPGPVRLTVKRAGNGSGTVIAPGRTCATECTVEAPFGSTVTLKGAAGAGSVFSGWIGSGCYSTPYDCSITLDGDKTVTAKFDLPPTCQNLTLRAPSGTATTVHFACSDPGARRLVGYYYRISEEPKHGTLGGLGIGGLPPLSGTFTYTPTPGYTGPDSISYGADFDAGFPTEESAFSNEASVTLNVVDATKPEISKLILSATAFRAASSGASISAAKTGARVSFSLSEASSVRFSVKGVGKGPRVKGSFKFAGKKGANSFIFRGRIGGKTLKPGRYLLNASAVDRSKNRSPKKSLPFKIIR